MKNSNGGLTKTRVLLIAGNLVLGALVVLALWRGNQADKVLAIKPVTIAVQDFPVEFRHDVNDFTVIRTRALFYSTREFYIAPDPALVVPTVPKPNYRLTGTLLTPQKITVALLSPEGGGLARKVIVGDELDGWRVKSVEPARVVVELGADQFEIAASKHVGGIGMLVKPLTRSSQASSLVGVRTLGSGGIASADVTSRGVLISEPRLYRPPSP